MKVQVSQYKDWHVLSLQGNFSVKTLAIVRKELEKVVRRNAPLVAIDLASVPGVDSSATGLLLNCAREVQKRLGCFALFNANEDLRQIFDMVGLLDTVPVYSHRKEFEEKAG